VNEQGQSQSKQPDAGDLKVPGRPPFIPRFWLILTLLLLFCALLKLPTLTFYHDEADEQVYWQLANRLLTVGQYNLQGTEILKRLSPDIYDRPVFNHPPLFPILLIPFVYWKIQYLAIVVPWLGHLLCVMAVALMCRRMARDFFPGMDQGQFIFWLPALGMALDPFLLFLSRRLWMDSLLAGLCAASIAFFFCARYSERRTWYLIAGGVFFGLAGLTKMPALALAPILLLLILTPEVRPRSTLRDLCFGCLPAVILLLPWFIIFYRTYGVFLPSWTRPDAWTIQRYPFIWATLRRSPFYYALKLATIVPVIVLCLAGYILKGHLWKKTVTALPCLWFLIFFIALWCVGRWGQGFQMRFLAPLLPSIYLMAAALLWEEGGEKDVLAMVVLLCFIYAGLTGAFYLLLPEYDEINPAFVLWKWKGL
jgi:4-amino-4-deoxy-L-arabinose transferase-like glycosyltransferase